MLGCHKYNITENEEDNVNTTQTSIKPVNRNNKSPFSARKSTVIKRAVSPISNINNQSQ